MYWERWVSIRSSLRVNAKIGIKDEPFHFSNSKKIDQKVRLVPSSSKVRLELETKLRYMSE